MSKLCLDLFFDADGSKDFCVENYWKILGNAKCKGYSNPIILPNGYLLMINNANSLIDVFTSKNVTPVLKDLEIFKSFPNGYTILGKSHEILGLYSPNGILLAKYVYSKKGKLGQPQPNVRNDIPVYTSSVRFFNRFTHLIKYNNVVLIDGEHVMLSKVDELEKPWYFIGKDKDILSISDSFSGMVCVKFVNNEIMLLNPKFEQINTGHKLINVNFLENGDFIAYTIKNKILLFNKNGILIKELSKKVEVVDCGRFYCCDGKKFDCYTHNEKTNETITLVYNKAKRCEIFLDDGVVFNRKRINNTEFITSCILASCPDDFKITDKRLMSFKYNNELYVFDLFSDCDETLYKIYNILNNVYNTSDLSLDMFNYLFNVIKLSHDNSITLKGMLKTFISKL